MNDQTAKADAGKAPLSLVPRRIIYDIARIREYGNQKYGDPDNWKNVEVERYRDAAFRHLLAYLDDPYGIDEESGLPHYWHLACNVAFICEMEDKKTCSPGYSPGVEVREIGEEIVKGAIDAITSKWPRKETERLNKAVELKIDKMSKHQSDFSDLDEEDVTDFDLSGYSDRLWRNAYERGKKEGERLVKQTIKKKELKVDQTLSTIIYRTLSDDDKWKDYELGEDETLSVTAKFDSEYEMDVKLCGSKEGNCWTEAVLFKNGAEVCCSDVGEGFFGTWELEDGDNKFVVVVCSNGGE